MTTIASFKKLITILAAAACICDLNVQLFAADKPAQAADNETASAVPHQGKGKLSLNTQVIRPADDSLDTAWTLGSRLQLDFFGSGIDFRLQAKTY